MAEDTGNQALAQEYEQQYQSGQLTGSDLKRYLDIRPDLIRKGVLSLPQPGMEATGPGATSLGTSGQRITQDPEATITQPPSALDQALRTLNRYGPPLVMGSMTGGASVPVQLGGQLLVTGAQQALGVIPGREAWRDPATWPQAVQPYAETALADIGGRVVGKGLQSVLQRLPPGQQYVQEQQRAALGLQAGRQASEMADVQEQYGRQISQAEGEAMQARYQAEQEANRALGRGTQRQYDIEQGAQGLAQSTAEGMTEAERLTAEAKDRYGLLQSRLTQMGDQMTRYRQLQARLTQAAEEGGAVTATNWLEKLPVLSDGDIAQLYRDVDKYNAQPLPASVAEKMAAAREPIAAREARIRAIVPEAVSPELERLGRAPAGTTAPGVPPSGLVNPQGQPMPSTVPQPTAPAPTFEGARDTLSRLGDMITEAKIKGEKVNAAAYTKLYSELWDAIEAMPAQAGTGEIAASAAERLRTANAAYKVKMTSQDVGELLRGSMHTPPGRPQIIQPGAAIDALNEDPLLQKKLSDIGVLDDLKSTLNDLQANLKAPKDALLKAQELENLAREARHRMTFAEQQTLAGYQDASARMAQYGKEGAALAKEDVQSIAMQAEAQAAQLKAMGSGLAQQAEARAAMLKDQAEKAAEGGKVTLEDIQRRQGLLPTTTMNPYTTFGLYPGVVGLGALALGHGPTGAAIALGGMEVPAMIGRLLMTPRGQALVGKVLEGSGGRLTPDAMAVLFQAAREPIGAATAWAQGQMQQGLTQIGQQYNQRFLSPMEQWLRNYGQTQQPTSSGPSQ